MTEERFQFNVTDNDGEIVIRHGEALPVFNPEGLKVSGQIGSPAEFSSMRNPDPATTHVTVDRKNGVITLTANDNLPHNQQHVITGSIQFHPNFIEFKIDKGKWEDPAALGELFRRRRRYFDNTDEGLKLVSALKNFSARVDKQLEKIEDKSARRYRSAVEKVIESNLPREVKLSMPVLNGFNDVEFNVEIALDVRDGGISIWLESPELEQLVEGLISSAIDRQLESLDKYVVIEL